MEHDERLHLADRGRSRDLGINPEFRGEMPHTRKDARALSTLESVGGWGDRNETVTSFAATPVNVNSSGPIVNGAGSLRGFSAFAAQLTIIRLYSGRTLIGALTVLANDTDTLSVGGDFGVSFNGLTVVITAPDLITPVYVEGAAWVATTE